MHDCDPSNDVHSALHGWFESPLGRSLQALEVNRLREVLPGLFGPTAVLFGAAGPLDWLDGSLAATRIVVDTQVRNAVAGNALRARGEAVPLASRSVHLAVLPHTLEFADDPHQVLREVARVLMPEGHAVVLGFNPVSLWGLRRLFGFPRHQVPWCGRFFSLGRVKDWLGVLGFSISGGAMLYYRPPCNSESARDRLQFLEPAGDRWWPMFGGVYVIVARKREIGMTPLQPVWRHARALAPSLAEPAAREQLHG